MKRHYLILISLLFLMGCSSGSGPEDPAKQEGQPGGKPGDAPVTSFNLKKITDEVCQSFDPRAATYTADPNFADEAEATVNEVKIRRYRTIEYDSYSVSALEGDKLEIAYFDYQSNGSYSKTCLYYQNNTDRIEKKLLYYSGQSSECNSETSPEYNADGKVVSETTVSTCTQFINGRKDLIRHKVFYDPETEREIRTEEDYGNDGTMDYVSEYDYDSTTGKLTEERYDEDGNGVFEKRVRYTYEDGHVSTKTTLNENNQRTELMQRYQSARSARIGGQSFNYTVIIYEFNPTTGATTRRCYYYPLNDGSLDPAYNVPLGNALACVPPR